MSLATIQADRADVVLSPARLRVAIQGAVQGVGFRPFIYRLATGMGLVGWVNNSSQGVFVEVEGHPEQLHMFLERIEAERPPRSFIQSMQTALLDPIGYVGFEVRQSDEAGAKTTIVTSNREPAEWLTMTADTLLAQSAIDRLTSAAHTLVIEGPSYRQRTRPRLDPDAADKHPQ